MLHDGDEEMPPLAKRSRQLEPHRSRPDALPDDPAIERHLPLPVPFRFEDRPGQRFGQGELPGEDDLCRERARGRLPVTDPEGRAERVAGPAHRSLGHGPEKRQDDERRCEPARPPREP